MKLHYFADAPNFGDALNPWLWPQVLGPLLDAQPESLFLGIGTILKRDLPDAKAYHVLGSGAGYGDASIPDQRWHIHAVRGPLTAAALGLPADRAVTDAAYLLRTVNLPSPAPGLALGFMPHFRAMPHTPWRRLCSELGLRYIDPLSPVTEGIAAIRGCDCLITEAMHGAIVADACRVPWLPVVTGGHVLDFKWRDWLASIEVECEPRRIANLRRIAPHSLGSTAPAALVRRGANALALGLQLIPLWRNLRVLRDRLESRRVAPFLSTENTVRARTDLLQRRLDEMRQELSAH